MKRRSQGDARRRRVRVRESRFGRELIVDGTFASFYEPGSPLTGSVWDALACPLLALPPRRRRSVLVLGLGGGSAARLVRALAPDALIVGVERDREVVRAARRHFDLDAISVEVVVDDALAFLERETRRFDAILEDVFIGSGDAVHKPDWLPRPGHDLAAARLAAGGLLVSNTLDEATRVARHLGAAHSGLLRIDVEDFDNRIFVAGPAGLSGATLRESVARHPLLRATLPRLSFRTLGSGAIRRGTAARSG